MRRLLPLAAIITALLALPALLVPASAEQLGAVLGLGETVAGAPTAVRPFPVLGGMGVTWAAPDGDPPTGYQVERRRPSGNWAGESGQLKATTTRWIDRNLQPDDTVEYRVLAVYPDDQVIASDPVTAHRVAQDPVVGDIDMLMIDSNRGDAATWLTDEIASPVSATGPADGSRTLSAGTIELRIPAVLPGPGQYDVSLGVTQGDRSCAGFGQIMVTDLAYTPDLRLATMAAAFDATSCTGTQNGVHGDIRIDSTKAYSAVNISPTELDIGRVRVDTTSDPRPIKITNAGIEPLAIDGLQVHAGSAQDWTLAHDCPTSLAVGASCTADVAFKPWHTGESKAELVFDDSTSLGWHGVTLRGTGTDLPGTYDLAVSATFRANLIQLPGLLTAGSAPVRGYFLHRYVDGVESTQWVYRDDDQLIVDQNPKPGVKYAVSVVNEVGEGPTGTPRAPAPATDQLAVVQDGYLKTADLSLRIAQLPEGSSLPQRIEAVAASPDGRRLAYMSGIDNSLWVRRVDPTELGPAVKIWTSPRPIRHPAWSPDGTRIAFEAQDEFDATVPCVYVIASAGGAPEQIGCGLGSPSWMPDAASLAVIDQRLDGYLAQVEAKVGGTRLRRFDTQVTQGEPVRVSPDGRYIAYGWGLGVQVIGIDWDSTHTSPSLGEGVVAISWSPDGGQLLAVTKYGRLSKLAVDYDGSLTETLRVQRYLQDVAWQGLGVVIGATPAVSGPRVSIAFDSSALPPGSKVECDLAGQRVAPCTSPVTATVTVSGTRSLRIDSEGPTGRKAVATRTFVVDATGPVARVTAPAYEASTAAIATVRYAATDSSGVKSYDVRYRKATYNGAFGAYSQPWTGTTATSVSLGLAAGYEYCVSVRARDTFGNLGAWSAERCFARPMDDRALTMASAGWTRGSWSAFYLNTATYTGKYGISLTRTVQGKRFYLVATRCSTCGLVSVYLGGKYIGAVNLWASTTQRQVVIGLPAQSSLFTGTLKITTRSTGKLVQIDGLGVRRT